MRRQQTPAFQLGINKQISLRYVFVSILSILLMIPFHIPAEAAWMGVGIEDSQSEEGKIRGVKVNAVDADGPGAQAGLQVGDLIVLVDSKTVESSSSLVKKVREAPEGTSLQMTILRKNERVSIQVILAKTPQHIIFARQGQEQAEKGNYDEAIRYYTKALEINPSYAVAYCNRGLAYGEKGQYDKAIFDFTKAMEINPREAWAYVARGAAYYAKGQYDQAISDCTKALEINPGEAEAYVIRGAAYCAKGQYDQAISDCTKALEIDPRKAWAYVARGAAYYYKKEYDKTWEDIKKGQDLGYQIPSDFLEDLRRASGRKK